MTRDKRFCIVVVALFGFIGAQGCHRPGANSAREGAIPDSVSGIVSVVGTSFEHYLLLRASNKTIGLAATSSDSLALTRLAGIETLVRGRLVGDTMRVYSFTAMRVDGAPVLDGIVVEKSGQLFLETTNGLRLIGNPPARLREMISSRIWMGGPVETGPNTYGVIVPSIVRQ